mmetsp:Transcript_7075/g.23442  ORF Transcript_7075/g.23442 Transcript_7075/m.23442 type:complete len:216 (+) Transcript_7075:1232-1879(+)
MHPVASVLLLLVVIIAAASIIVVAVRVTIVAIIIPRRVPSPVDCVKNASLRLIYKVLSPGNFPVHIRDKGRHSARQAHHPANNSRSPRRRGTGIRIVKSISATTDNRRRRGIRFDISQLRRAHQSHLGHPNHRRPFQTSHVSRLVQNLRTRPPRPLLYGASQSEIRRHPHDGLVRFRERLPRRRARPSASLDPVLHARSLVRLPGSHNHRIFQQL